MEDVLKMTKTIEVTSCCGCPHRLYSWSAFYTYYYCNASDSKFVIINDKIIQDKCPKPNTF